MEDLAIKLTRQEALMFAVALFFIGTLFAMILSGLGQRRARRLQTERDRKVGKAPATSDHAALSTLPNIAGDAPKIPGYPRCRGIVMSTASPGAEKKAQESPPHRARPARKPLEHIAPAVALVPTGRLLSEAEAAQVIGCGTSTLASYRLAGKNIPHERRGNRVLYRDADIPILRDTVWGGKAGKRMRARHSANKAAMELAPRLTALADIGAFEGNSKQLLSALFMYGGELDITSRALVIRLRKIIGHLHSVGVAVEIWPNYAYGGGSSAAWIKVYRPATLTRKQNLPLMPNENNGTTRD